MTYVASLRESTSLLNIIDLNQYSTLSRAVRIIALVLFFIEKCRKTRKPNTITAADFRNAKYRLCKAVQQCYYELEMKYLGENPPKSKQPSIIQQLGLYLDSMRLIRCRGRIENANLPEKTKFPILLPKDSLLAHCPRDACNSSSRWCKRNTHTYETDILDSSREATCQKSHIKVRNMQES